MTDSAREVTEQYNRDNHAYLALHGKTLLAQGYTVVPIQQGKKAPGFDGWQKSKATTAQLASWLEDGYKRSGVGILTKYTPGVDIDVRDEKVALEMETWCREHLGDAPLRIGEAPKRLLLYRTDEPFRKLTSNKYKDEWNDIHRIEILGDGQQFVAYHLHPETKKPYYWPEEKNPLNTRSSELVTITMEQAQAVLDKFHEIAEREGWQLDRKAPLASKALDSDNPWVEDSAPVTITDDELRNRLMLVPHPDDYDEWIKVGMALFHQYNGEDEGLKLWHEWAETSDKYDADALDRRWAKFEINGKKRAPITARYILRISQEAAETAAQEAALDLRMSFLNAKTLIEWEKARQKARNAEIDSLSRSALAVIAKQSRDQLTGTKTALVEIKKSIAYSPKATEKTPGWAEEWTYDTSCDRFFNTATKTSTSQQGFNAMFDRKAMTRKDIIDGKSSPSSTASALALNLYRIPTVVGQRYMPGMDAIFTEPDGTFVNTYPEHEIPVVPEKLKPRDKANIERVKKHIKHLLENTVEQRMFLDWLSWVVQNPGQHARYAVLLQGVEGDGKTFFAEMMRAVMGVSNVTMLNAHILHSDFTDWAEGQCLACFEEVRLVNDKNKYETLNRMKPYITNTINEIHPKGQPVRNVKNTTSYLMFTNFKDALPIDDNSRRYLVLFSRWQNREDLKQFKAENEDYYVELYATIEESAGALRQWLLGHEQANDFNPKGDAPDTIGRRHMIRRAKAEFIQQLDDLIEENETIGACAELVDITEVSGIFYTRDIDVPAAKTLASMMERDGYEPLGRVAVGEDKHSFWSKTPQKFKSLWNQEIRPDPGRIKRFLAKRVEELDDF